MLQDHVKFIWKSKRAIIKEELKDKFGSLISVPFFIVRYNNFSNIALEQE
jgi:hypothetical protein